MEESMRTWIIAATTLVLAGAPMAAQETAHWGFALNLNAPVGGFSETVYEGPTRNTYDPTVGVAFLASFPVDRTVAFRLNLSGTTFTGHSDQETSRYRIQDSLFSLGGDAQIFLGNGNAQRHVGTYLIGGLSLDLERFVGNQDDSSYYYTSNSTDAGYNRARLAGTVGIGHSFRYGGRMRWIVEGVYHKTLTGTSDNIIETVWSGYAPRTDFLKFSFGMMF
jgi:hypothetical protein